MASVEICWRKRNLKSSCDDIIGTVEDTRAIIIMKICGMFGVLWSSQACMVIGSRNSH